MYKCAELLEFFLKKTKLIISRENMYCENTLSAHSDGILTAQCEPVEVSERILDRALQRVGRIWEFTSRRPKLVEFCRMHDGYFVMKSAEIVDLRTFPKTGTIFKRNIVSM